MENPVELETDVAIVGGGLVGLSLSLALARAGLDCVVVDLDDPVAKADDAFDGRGSAIALGSARVLQAIGLWPLLARHAEPILDIRVSDGDSQMFLHYDHRELGSDPFGYIIENRHTRRALYARLAQEPRVRLVAPDSAAEVTADAAAAHVRLASGGTIAARLVVACDGRPSPTRKAAGIGALRWEYAQHAIVCAISHEKPHRGIANERFLPAGPFAVLPLPDAPDGTHLSSIVWTERAELARMFVELPEDEFADEIHERFGWGLGRIALASRRWCYPLVFVQAERATGPRLVLAGDALHGIHPIAGQGLNLGLRDVAALAEVLADSSRLGLDIGAADTLERYARWRGVDTVGLSAVTDGLLRLFSNDIAPLKLARDVGLAVVDRIAPLKRVFMRDAMGTLGKLPRLMKGEPL
ncbi:MAG: UbiH/UbiF/VisC/COQ6 family ubiquinone biosynthesis hydroxylase [Rhodospirillales bacterium]|nr:UbiH/UbiF/VisC/COQ6 family ubiquinone biosynthesis hydroxylase [Rhodospirillales bacterium]